MGCHHGGVAAGRRAVERGEVRECKAVAQRRRKGKVVLRTEGGRERDQEEEERGGRRRGCHGHVEGLLQWVMYAGWFGHD